MGKRAIVETSATRRRASFGPRWPRLPPSNGIRSSPLHPLFTCTEASFSTNGGHDSSRVDFPGSVRDWERPGRPRGCRGSGPFPGPATWPEIPHSPRRKVGESGKEREPPQGRPGPRSFAGETESMIFEATGAEPSVREGGSNTDETSTPTLAPRRRADAGCHGPGAACDSGDDFGRRRRVVLLRREGERDRVRVRGRVQQLRHQRGRSFGAGDAERRSPLRPVDVVRALSLRDRPRRRRPQPSGAHDQRLHARAVRARLDLDRALACTAPSRGNVLHLVNGFVSNALTNLD